jgi:hypothetical protein
VPDLCRELRSPGRPRLQPELSFRKPTILDAGEPRSVLKGIYQPELSFERSLSVHAREPQWVLKRIHQPKSSPVVESMPWEAGPPPGRYPVLARGDRGWAGGYVGRDSHQELAGHLNDAGLLVADAIRLPVRLEKAIGFLVAEFGLPAHLGEVAGHLTQAEKGILLSIIMAQGDIVGYTGQSEIVEVEATKAAVEFNLGRTEGDAKELGRLILAARPGDRSLPILLQALGRVLTAIARLKKDHKNLGVERAKALYGTVFIGGYEGKT